MAEKLLPLVLLVPQRFYRIETGGFSRGVVTKEYPDTHRKGNSKNDRLSGDICRPARKLGEKAGRYQPEHDTDNAANEAHNNRFHQKLSKYVPRSGAD